MKETLTLDKMTNLWELIITELRKTKCVLLCVLTTFSLSLLSSCVGHSDANRPLLTVVIFNGHGEDVEVIFNGKKLVHLENTQTDENNVAAIRKIERIPGKIELLVKRNGKLAGRFFVDPKRIGTVYIFLSPDGSVILEDGDKLPPVV